MRDSQVILHYKDSMGSLSGKQEIGVDDVYGGEAHYLKITYDTGKIAESKTKAFLNLVTAKLKTMKF